MNPNLCTCVHCDKQMAAGKSVYQNLHTWVTYCMDCWKDVEPKLCNTCQIIMNSMQYNNKTENMERVCLQCIDNKAHNDFMNNRNQSAIKTC